MKTGAKILVESLQREGTEIIFGYPGGVVLPIYDELYDSSLRHILVRHEQAAAHAADGYARASGRVGVCLATSGPGACNLVTGIATAYMDSIPVVALTGQVPTNLLGNDAFQESDITGITMPVTKHNYLVKSAGELEPGRPGSLLHRRDRQAGTGPDRYPQGREYRPVRGREVCRRKSRSAATTPPTRATNARSRKPSNCSGRPSARSSMQAGASSRPMPRPSWWSLPRSHPSRSRRR